LRIKKLVQDIPSVSYYTVPLHLQPVLQNLGYKTGDFPVAERIADQCLSLPMSAYLNCDDQNKINKEILNLIR
jgi:UDP-2-acetamido-2-deoxy-ribo-hexuluronate aminotransferase